MAFGEAVAKLSLYEEGKNGGDPTVMTTTVLSATDFDEENEYDLELKATIDGKRDVYIRVDVMDLYRIIHDRVRAANN